MNYGMKIAICDDEKPIRDYIEKCVHEAETDIEVVQYPDASKIIAPGFDADILFLDIKLPKMDGMQAARILRTMGSGTIIVFVTAVEEYVFQAFDVEAAQYIVKPFDREKLTDTIKRVIKLAKERKSIDSALSERDEKSGGRRSIVIKSDGINRRVILAAIVYAEVLEHRIILHMSDKESFNYYGKMSDLEKLSGQDFYRVHRAYLVNLAYVNSYNSKSVAVPSEELPMARGKYREFVKAYLSYHTRKENL